jgi:hypothetical protein
MSEKIKRSELPEGYIISGVDKPDPVPGKKWFPVRNNPNRPQQTKAWRLGKSGTGRPPPVDGVGNTKAEEAQGSSAFPGPPRKVTRVQKGVDLDK